MTTQKIANNQRRSLPSGYRQNGQSTIGYAIATSIMVFSLFVPWGNNPAAVVQFMEHARALHQNVTYVLSLP